MSRSFLVLGLFSTLCLASHPLKADELLIKVGTIGGSDTTGQSAAPGQPAVDESNKNHRLSLSYGFTSEQNTQYLRISQYERLQKFNVESNQTNNWEKGLGLGYSYRHFESIFAKTSVFADAGIDLEQGSNEYPYQGRTDRQSVKISSEVGLRLQSDQGAFFEFSTQLAELSYSNAKSKSDERQSTTKSWSVATIGQTSMVSTRLGVGLKF